MVNEITVRGAQPKTREEEIKTAIITISGCFPYSTSDEEVGRLRQSFLEDAETLFQALLDSLPGGTFCQLVGLMLQEKASHFIVSYKPTVEYQKIEAASEMFDTLRACADYFHDFTEHDKEETRLAAICRAAIAKARGEREAQHG